MLDTSNRETEAYMQQHPYERKMQADASAMREESTLPRSSMVVDGEHFPSAERATPADTGSGCFTSITSLLEIVHETHRPCVGSAAAHGGTFGNRCKESGAVDHTARIAKGIMGIFSGGPVRKRSAESRPQHFWESGSHGGSPR